MTRLEELPIVMACDGVSVDTPVLKSNGYLGEVRMGVGRSSVEGVIVPSVSCARDTHTTTIRGSVDTAAGADLRTGGKV